MKKILPFLLASVLTICCSSAFAATDIFVKINGITGNTTATGFTGYFELLQTGQANTGCTTPGGGTCAGVPGNFNFQMLLNEAAPVLQARLFAGTIIPTVDFVFRKIVGNGTSFIYYQVHLESVVVKSVAEVSGDVAPTEQYAFSFQKIAWKYIPQTSTGAAGTPILGCWNFATNTGGTAGTCSSYTFPF